MTGHPPPDALQAAALAPLTWVEVSSSALQHNVRTLRAVAEEGGRQPLTCVMVKGNAYGHGLVQAARAFVAGGVDWLGVADVFEARDLRAAGITVPLYAVCHVPAHQADYAVAQDLRLTVYDRDVVDAAAAAARSQGRTAHLHIKLETGTNRQGLRHEEALDLCRHVLATEGARLDGLSTHFADIEDTTDHRFALRQLTRFQAGVCAVRQLLTNVGRDPSELIAHASNTAAVLLWPEVSLDLVRFGIGAYGLWPSKETFLSAQQLGRRPIDLRPALTWKTQIAQVKEVPPGEWVGYGRTFRSVRVTKLAILPIGYYDGYDRGLSGLGQVLIGGQRAPVVGRVAMNMVAVDVTDNPRATAGDEVVLLGKQAAAEVGAEPADEVTAGQLAGWLGTIHYEVVTRIHERIERRLAP